ncbi:MAG: (2Fe-2S)-binding protein [Burkholderiaceae bacterium]|nr:(2Fe-2S)-binding protein [Burkholderiaceae bacterium]
MELLINTQRRAVPEGWQDESLLWVLREALGLVGTRLGCGQGQCGACTVLLDGAPVRSCQLPVQAAVGRAVQTVEGLGEAHPLVQAWLDEAVAQCGYCQSGQLMAAAALLRRQPRPAAAEVVQALDGHLCRCGSQVRVVRAVLRAAAVAGPSPAGAAP